MKITLEIVMDNDAFGTGKYCRASEVGRILREVIRRIDKDGIANLNDGWKLMDINGNSVGMVEIK